MNATVGRAVALRAPDVPWNGVGVAEPGDQQPKRQQKKSRLKKLQLSLQLAAKKQLRPKRLRERKQHGLSPQAASALDSRASHSQPSPLVYQAGFFLAGYIDGVDLERKNF